MFKKIFISGLIFVLILVPGIANATQNYDQVAALLNRMDELGVSADSQASLVDLIVSGGTPDSNKPEAIPTSTTSQLVAGWLETKSVFADGSVQITKIQQPQNPLLRATISGCKVQTGTGYKNYLGCVVDNNTITTYFGFTSDFGYVNGARDYISSVYDPFVHCFFGSCPDYSLVLTKKYEDANGPAAARLSTVFTLVGGAASSTTSISLLVGNDTSKVVVK